MYFQSCKQNPVYCYDGRSWATAIGKTDCGATRNTQHATRNTQHATHYTRAGINRVNYPIVIISSKHNQFFSVSPVTRAMNCSHYEHGSAQSFWIALKYVYIELCEIAFDH